MTEQRRGVEGGQRGTMFKVVHEEVCSQSGRQKANYSLTNAYSATF